MQIASGTSRRKILSGVAGVLAAGVGGYYAWDRGLLHGLLKPNSWKERLVAEINEPTAKAIWPGGISEIGVRPNGEYTASILQAKGWVLCFNGQKTDPFEMKPNIIGLVPGKGPFYWVSDKRLLGQQFRLGLGNTLSAPHDSIKWGFAPRTGRFVYAALNNSKWVIYKDIDVPSQELDYSLLGLIITDTGRVAFSVLKQQQTLFSAAKTEVHFGDRSWEVEGVESPFGGSSDGSVLGTLCSVGQRVQIRIGDIKGPLFDWISSYAFSPDAVRFAYAARQGNRWFLVQGNETGPAYDQLGDVQFSPISPKPFFWAMRDGRWSIEGPKNRGSATELPPDTSVLVVSPDGEHVAYRTSGGDHVVVDRSASPSYVRVDYPAFSPDGRKVGFGAQIGHQIWWKVKDVS